MAGKVQRSEDTPWTSLEGEVLMMSIERGQYFALNEVGSRIWELLEQPIERDAIVERLLQEFDVPRETCSAQVESFMAKIEERGLLKAA